MGFINSSGLVKQQHCKEKPEGKDKLQKMTMSSGHAVILTLQGINLLFLKAFFFWPEIWSSRLSVNVYCM